MTTITAKIIADSVSEQGPRLTTLHLRYPRFIHSELLTHRVFSRNARSSRAVPIEKMIAEIESCPVVPLHWGAAQKGMQADHECDAGVWIPWESPEALCRRSAWLLARDKAVEVARAFAEAGYHKQVANRLLEPFMHIDVLVTATEWSNFFALRIHPAAEPHMRMLAEAIKRAMEGSTPRMLKPGDWHAPYVGDGFLSASNHPITQENGKRISVARCARISYKPFDSESENVIADLELAKQLASSGHWSPFEHQATPDAPRANGIGGYDGWWNSEDQGNFVGWRQHRRIVERETRRAA